MLTLLFSKDKDVKIEEEGTAAELYVTPQEIDWSDTIVGQVQNKQIEVKANTSVTIDETQPVAATEISGLDVRPTCTKGTQINENIACIIRVEYKPTRAQPKTQVQIKVKWHETDNSNPNDIIEKEKPSSRVPRT